LSHTRADLHTHSTCSDGTETPEALLHLAKEKGLFGLSITDHDTIEAYTPELFSQAKDLDIKLLVGSELSSRLNGESVHILAYNFDINSSSFQNFMQKIQSQRLSRNKRILEKLKALEIEIDSELLKKSAVIGRPHIAKILIDKKIVRNMKEAFEFYLKDGGKAYVPGERPSPMEVIKEIHKAKGKAFIAHPHLMSKNIFSQLLHYPFDGIECYYARFSKEMEKPFLDIAEKKGMLISGGSDFHGSIKPLNALGCSWVDDKTFALIKDE